MFFWRQSERPTGGIYDWLRENRQQIMAGTADYQGIRVCDTTEFRQHKFVVSCGLVALTFWTQHEIPTPENGRLRSTAWTCTLITLLCGWWCFPWGPPLTIHTVYVNLTGGRKRTAASLLQLVEWGWDAPADASASDHQRKLVEISPDAAAEIHERRLQGNFDASLAVRLMPTKEPKTEVRIAFDYPVSDGRDWVDQSEGILLLIGKEHEFELSGTRLEFADGKFFVA